MECPTNCIHRKLKTTSELRSFPNCTYYSLCCLKGKGCVSEVLLCVLLLKCLIHFLYIHDAHDKILLTLITAENKLLA